MIISQKCQREVLKDSRKIIRNNWHNVPTHGIYTMKMKPLIFLSILPDWIHTIIHSLYIRPNKTLIFSAKDAVLADRSKSYKNGTFSTEILYYIFVEIFIVMSNKLEKFRNVSIWWRNKQFCDQNTRTLFAYKTWNIASLFQKIVQNDPDIILRKI